MNIKSFNFDTLATNSQFWPSRQTDTVQMAGQSQRAGGLGQAWGPRWQPSENLKGEEIFLFWGGSFPFHGTARVRWCCSLAIMFDTLKSRSVKSSQAVGVGAGGQRPRCLARTRWSWGPAALAVSLSRGCCNEAPQSGGLKQQGWIFS